MEAERLMVLYGDGAVEVRYAGGSRLLLSPCGCEYLHEAAPPAAAHPLQPAGTSRQRVAFAVSAYRVRGGSALSGPVRDGGSSPGGRCLAAAANRVSRPHPGPCTGHSSLCSTATTELPFLCVKRRGLLTLCSGEAEDETGLKLYRCVEKPRDVTGLCCCVLSFMALQ